MRRDVFNAIADPTRRGILLSLTVEKQNVNTLAEQFEMSRQAVSLHLKYLEECGVVIVKKEGRERICELELKAIAELANWLKPFKILWEKRYNQLDNVFEALKNESKNKTI